VVADRVEVIGELHCATSVSEPLRRGGFKASSPRKRQAWPARASTTLPSAMWLRSSLRSKQRGAPVAANKELEVDQDVLSWCVGRASSINPRRRRATARKEVARDRVLDDQELAQVILAARKLGGPYAGIVNSWRLPASAAKKSRG